MSQEVTFSCGRCNKPAPAHYSREGWAHPHDVPVFTLCREFYAGMLEVRAKTAQYRAGLMGKYMPEQTKAKE